MVCKLDLYDNINILFLTGYYCSNKSEASNPSGVSYGDECPAGYYCPDHSYMPTPCPPGTYQPNTKMTNITGT